MWSIHTIECFSTKKRREILTPAIMNFEDIMLREISQSQKDKNGIHSEEVPRIVKAARAQGRGVWSCCLMGTEFQCGKAGPSWRR